MRDLTEKQRFWKTHLEAIETFDGCAAEYAARSWNQEIVFVQDAAARTRSLGKDRFCAGCDNETICQHDRRRDGVVAERSTDGVAGLGREGPARAVWPTMTHLHLWPEGLTVYLHRAPVDFRKQINGLAVLVTESMEPDLFKPAFFVFVNGARNRVKVLYWDSQGLCVCLKRLTAA